jgi:hypothetical protein
MTDSSGHPRHGRTTEQVDNGGLGYSFDQLYFVVVPSNNEILNEAVPTVISTHNLTWVLVAIFGPAPIFRNVLIHFLIHAHFGIVLFQFSYKSPYLEVYSYIFH